MPIVRLKPHNPRLGHRLRSLIDSANDGKRYSEGSLYTVSATEAEHLSWFMQDASRMDPKAQVFGMARAFDVFPTMASAKVVLEEEARGQLMQPSANQVFKAPGRDAPEAPALASAEEVTEDFNRGDSFSRDAAERPPTALERRRAAMNAAKAKKAG